MSTKSTKKNKTKSAASSSSLHEVDNGPDGKKKNMVCFIVGLKAKTLSVVKLFSPIQNKMP